MYNFASVFLTLKALLNDETHATTDNGGLPDIASLRIFPLDGQALPAEGDLTDVAGVWNEGWNVLEVYSLSGRLLYRTSESRLGVSLGKRSSAIMVLPNCVGGTPYIVRKQRLK